MSDMTGKVAVVVGCSGSRGTGWAVAKALAGAGAKVVVAARRLDKLEQLAAEIGGTAVACDVSNEEQVAEVAATALRTYGKLDVAVNAAALVDMSTVSGATRAQLQAAMDVNYFGNVVFVQRMAEAIGSDGSIIIFSSLASTMYQSGYFAYGASKAAADYLVRHAAVEYGDRGIRVNSILPGPILSDVTAEMLSQESIVNVIKREIPLNRIGFPQDFADAVLWLAGPSFVTGLNIPVCGGLQLNRLPRPDDFQR
ncbi:SDR family NAD(P)-dependent oxidoreductase [Sphingomonas sp.]|uniref:SDR family NAD(P)-dependent oxidoreductase n=1 Tax=Sphingomonas sp. TaxID=28214 RepID=UPI003AFF6DF8